MSRVLLIIFPFWAAAFRAAALGLDGADCGVLRSRAQSLDRANAVTLARGRKRVPARGTHGRLAARSITSATHRSGLQRSERAMTRMTYISSAIIAVTLLVSVEAAAQQSGPKASAQAPWFGLWCCRLCLPTPGDSRVGVCGRRRSRRTAVALRHRRQTRDRPPKRRGTSSRPGLDHRCDPEPPSRRSHRRAGHAQRKALAAKYPAALSRVHVAAGMFKSRRASGEADANPMVAAKSRCTRRPEAPFHRPDGPVELQPGVWLTGPAPANVPRAQLERLVEGCRRPTGFVEDTLPEDQALARPHCSAASASSPAVATQGSATSSRMRGLLPD